MLSMLIVIERVWRWIDGRWTALLERCVAAGLRTNGHFDRRTDAFCDVHRVHFARPV